MLRTSRLLPLLVLLLGLAGACDRAPTAPGSDDIAALILRSYPGFASDVTSARGTLPNLFREAIEKIEEDGGRSGVESALAGWRKLQDDLTAAGSMDRSAVQAKLDAIHNEEIRVVLRGLGPNVISRVLSETNIGLAEARTKITAAENDGADMDRAKSIAAHIGAQISSTRQALAANDTRSALDRISQASGMLTGLTFYLRELGRIPGLETLFPEAVEKLKADPADARTRLAALEKTNDAARVALRAGDRSTANERLREARAEQTRIVLDVLGPSTAHTLVEQVGKRSGDVRTALRIMKDAGNDVGRHERMLRQVTDLYNRARTALLQGDGATALDLGSHAAGILNTLQHSTWP